MKMDSHGTGERPGILGNGVESIQEVSKSIDHINDYDSLLQTNSSPATSRGAEHEGDSLPEVPSIDLNRSCDAGPDGLKEQKTIFVCCEVSQLRDPSLSSSPQVRRGLDHCITAPVHRNLFLENQDAAFSRSMTERWGSPLPALKLDRLSEREKKNLIVNLVKIQNDGTVEVDLTKDSPVTSELLELHPVDGIPSTVDYITTDYNKSIPKLKIALLVVGTRGDVQPFLAVARRLQEYGHHVRLATHSNFRGFVKSAGVDFYPLGGDPRVLAGYMARNKGLIPSSPGEISIQRKQIKAIIESLLPACTEPDPITGEPFRAQAIIANPPAYGHAHVAEALGVPLHIFFTMPWTQATYAFPHPLARVPQSAGYWKNKLKLPPIAYFSTYHGSISHLPTGYMWSPHVVPKPTDSKLPDNVFLLVDCPHDWLFPQCLCVLVVMPAYAVHHGGAGTTATGLKAGCPTTIVPFFGDQFFWGERIYHKGLGPAPIPISQLNIESLSEAIRFMLQPEVKSRATELAACIQNEDGVGTAVDAFHRHLPPQLPLPAPSLGKDDGPNPLQRLFIQIGRLCCLPCGS
ncbi:Sterol 3-beta-glucosyltransferase UGT80B1 [Sesamum angolense]|uniref:Sterol 3-beta-glucosyltransferase UGT80B1 n=1 Tax=Sesamum angolense TaxID=2727404 RepID=A0AAE1WCY6_9LAMI|nr:Sterol 3-beta-glucosyltransferase UGT80B1 [Sesamum angolense]